MADDDNKIVIPVEVTGDDEARRKIEALSDTMQRAVKAGSDRAGISPEEFQRRGDAFKNETDARNAVSPADGKDRDSKTAPNLEQKVFGETNAEVGRTAEAVRLFREALHALHPAAAEAGIGLGEMTALIRASTGGVVALAAAVGGLLVAALEKAGDAANDAANRLGTFSPGGNAPGGGRESLAGLQATGRQLNEFPTSLANPYEQLLRINQNQPPGQQKPDSDLREVLANLVKGLQAERVDPEKGLGALTELLKSIQEKGFVTGDSLKALQEIAPRLSATLIQELNKQKPGGASFSDQQFLNASRSAGGNISLDKVKSDSEFPDSISTAWHSVKVAADRLSEISDGGHLIAGGLDKFASFLDLIGAAAKNIQDKYPTALDASKAGAGAALRLVTPFGALSTLGGNGETEKPGTADQQDRLNTSFDRTAPRTGPDGVSDAASKLREAFLSLHPAVEGVQKTLEDYAQKQKELGYVAKDAALKQAELEKRFQPAETASKLAKDVISVQSADINLANAKISGAEAKKGQELSRLAPEEARENVADAQSNRDKALAEFLKHRGVNTAGLEAANARDEDIRSLNRAETALKRAQIEKKYSGLEEPKADLAAKQAQTAIKSAELEKNDRSLTLAKDKQGAPIAHELAQLRYAQAALDFDQVKVDLLKKILEKIGASTDDKDKTKTDDEVKPQQVTPVSDDPTQDTRHVRTVNGERAAREALQPVNAKPPVAKPLAGDEVKPVNNDDTPLYRPSYGEPKRPPITERSNTGTRLNPLDNEQGLYGSRPPGTFNGPNEQGLKPQSPADQQSSLEQPKQQIASLGSALQELLTSAAAAINNAKTQDNTVKDLPSGGVRGDNAAPSGDEGLSELSDAAGSAKESLSSLAEAISNAVNQIASAASSAGEGGTVYAAEGGHIRGPGTSTSDSINAQLSDGEYVHPADATSHYGVPFMDAIRTKSLPKFAIGGMFGAMSRAMSAGAPSLSTAGRDASSAPSSAASKMEHWGTVDMRSDRGDFKVATERDTMRHLSSAAQKAKRYSTGAKPGWYGGGQ